MSGPEDKSAAAHNFEEARAAIQKAVKALSAIVVDDCAGTEELAPRARQVAQQYLPTLLEIKVSMERAIRP